MQESVFTQALGLTRPRAVERVELDDARKRIDLHVACQAGAGPNGVLHAFGTADRNRTLNMSNLMAIEVPTPPLAAQQTFDRPQAEIIALKARHAAIRAASAALLPATLERVFACAAAT